MRMNGWWIVWIVGATLIGVGEYWLLMRISRKHLLKDLQSGVDETLELASDRYTDAELGRKERRLNRRIDYLYEKVWVECKKKAIRSFVKAFLVSLVCFMLQCGIATIMKEEGCKLCIFIAFYLVGVTLYTMIRWRKENHIWCEIPFALGPMAGFLLLCICLDLEWNQYWVLVANYVGMIPFLALGLAINADQSLRKKVSINKTLNVLRNKQTKRI